MSIMVNLKVAYRTLSLWRHLLQLPESFSSFFLLSDAK